MKRLSIYRKLLIVLLVLAPAVSMAGPYAPEADQEGSTAVSMDGGGIVAWATGWEQLQYGTDLDATWKTPEKATGPAEGRTDGIVSLGRGGSITMTFDSPIGNGDAWDFAVFENGVTDTFLELAYVEVSSNGSDFARFDNDSKTGDPVAGFGAVDPSNIDGLAGKYRQGYGTPFDLQDLATENEVQQGLVNLSKITHVRIVDIVGDGTCLDSDGDIVYDPYPTNGSAGFDLDGVGVRYENDSMENSPPETPYLTRPENGASDISSAPTFATESFSDPDDAHLLTKWQIGRTSDLLESDRVFERISSTNLESLTLPTSILEAGKTYYWRVMFFDSSSVSSEWSEVFEFTTSLESNPSEIIHLDWDGDGLIDSDIPTVNTVNTNGEQVQTGIQPSDNVMLVDLVQAIDIDTTESSTRPEILPTGLVSFRLQVVDSTEYAEVVVHLSEPAPDNGKWYKYDSVQGWREYEHATFDTGRTRITLRLKDGSEEYGDIDGLKNGLIVDPGGVGALVVPEDGQSGLDDRGGCFVTASASGSDTMPKLPVILLLLAGLLLLKKSPRRSRTRHISAVLDSRKR
ncbi:MAG: hypothetical protein GY866_31850 [Proteobacteria bacterium]|nr:hypothetical protein [Pseudomonadota bacterium]